MPEDSEPFWKTTPLGEMSRDQWESLCDGCGKCCLQKIEDVDTHQVYFTNIVCDQLDLETCRCKVYADRSRLVSTCVVLSPTELKNSHWLPSTCAYRLLAEGRELPAWHPLISGHSHGALASGHSVKGRVIPESDADDWEYHLIDWA